MKLVLDQSEGVAAWVASRIPFMAANPDFGPCVGVGIVDSLGSPVGGVVFHGYRPEFGSVEISHAYDTPKALTRALISGILAIPFAQYGVNRLTACTPRNATSARRFLEKFGFRLEGVIRKGLGTDDACIYGLLREEWDQHRFNLQRGALSGGKEHASAASGPRSHRRRKRAKRGEHCDGGSATAHEHGQHLRANGIGHVRC